jgi:hypothetical protein
MHHESVTRWCSPEEKICLLHNELVGCLCHSLLDVPSNINLGLVILVPTLLDRQEWPHVFNISSDSDHDADTNTVSLVEMDISNGFVKDDPIKNL